MKDQYFGDINDYRKYSLLRAIITASDLRLLIAWMLTADDGSADGKFTSYLQEPSKWSGYDPVLYRKLKELLNTGQRRTVRLIENTSLLPGAKYYSLHVPDKASSREQWFGVLAQKAQGCDLVFLDPDNGLEVKSRPYGRKGSSKFLYWREVEALWASGKSLLIYQHFIRENRIKFIQRMKGLLSGSTPGSLVEGFSTPHVLFLLALQPAHHQFHGLIVDIVQDQWKDQISIANEDNM